MSAANVELVRRFHALISAGEHDAAAELAHPDVVWRHSEDPFAEPTELSGHAAVRELWGKLHHIWEEFRVDVEHCVDAGNHVVVSVEVTGRGRASGIDVTLRFAELFMVRDGLIARRESYPDRDAALAAIRGPVPKDLVEQVRYGYAAVNRRDVEGLLSVMHPDLELVPVFSGVSGASYRGLEGARRWFDETVETFEAYQLELLEIERFGDWVLATAVIHGRGRASGAAVDQPYSQVLHSRDGRFDYIRTCFTREEALADVRSGR